MAFAAPPARMEALPSPFRVGWKKKKTCNVEKKARGAVLGSASSPDACGSVHEEGSSATWNRRSALAAPVAATALSFSSISRAEDDPSMGGDPEITQEVFMDMNIGGQPAGRIVVGLYGKLVPKTAENFATLASGNKAIGYKGSIFHRVIPGFVLQA
eukprot:jgi/Pico_ML_1/54846/g704.t1